jgi:hypothetical protein
MVPRVNLFLQKRLQIKLQPFFRVKTRYSFITRSKKTFTLSVDKLPNISKNPQNVNLNRGPEWDSTVGKAVRLAQLKYPNCIVLTRVGSFWEVILVILFAFYLLPFRIIIIIILYKAIFRASHKNCTTFGYQIDQKKVWPRIYAFCRFSSPNSG